MNMKLTALSSLLCLLFETISGHEHGAVKVFVQEDSDVILPCSPSTKESLVGTLFDWRRDDGRKDVFMYKSGNITIGAEEFKGRVSHFKDELKNGNASIIIRNTTLADSGIYTCDLPRLEPAERFHIELVVGAVKVVVQEDSDVILPCSPSTKENLVGTLFDWRRDDGRKDVFMYESGIIHTGAEEFKGRVSHFTDELKNGNASIIIRNTTIEDSGNYTCDLPRLEPAETFHIELVVGASPEPSIMIVHVTKDQALLQCVVRGASPKPEVEFQDSAGNILPAEKPQVSEGGRRYTVILVTTVTKTDYIRCVAKQKEIHHETSAETYVTVCDTHSKVDVTGWIGGYFLGVFSVVAVLALIVATKLIRRRCITGPCQQRKNSSNNPLTDPPESLTPLRSAV